MKSSLEVYKKTIVRLRRSGHTYAEIAKVVGVPIPKSTLSSWCGGIVLTENARQRIARIASENLKIARRKSLANRSVLRAAYWNSLFQENQHYADAMANKQIAKLVLAALFIGEGSKTASSSLVFGNSNVHVVKLFLRLLRVSYALDESRLRCTVQCRADQNQEELIKFWSNATGVSTNQFYRTRVDVRTVGKPSKKQGYKGVCRIDYFSADVYNELRVISSVLFGLGHLGL